MRLRCIATIGLALAVPAMLCSGPAGAQATAEVSVGTAVPTLERYKAPASDTADKPRGLSGMACLSEKLAADKGGDPTRECIAIIDEESFAEIVTLSVNGLKPTGRTVPLTETKQKITGTQRVAPCSKKDKDFDEFDGEGIAIADGYVYLTGSHSCSGKDKYKPSSYLLARFKHSTANSFFDGEPAVERTWRGADLLLNSPVKNSYGKKKGKGTNIEGLAVAGGRLYVGLRTPVGKDGAYILSAPVAELFASGEQPLDGNSVKSISLELGKGVGIRDLAALPQSGGLLILSGPTLEQKEIPYKLWHLPPPLDAKGAGLSERVIIKTNAVAKKGLPKAESITVLREVPATKKITVLVNYDNIDEGAPARHELTLKP